MLMTNPAMTGPINSVICRAPECSVTAFRMWDRLTVCATSDTRAGFSIACDTPTKDVTA